MKTAPQIFTKIKVEQFTLPSGAPVTVVLSGGVINQDW